MFLYIISREVKIISMFNIETDFLLNNNIR